MEPLIRSWLCAICEPVNNFWTGAVIVEDLVKIAIPIEILLFNGLVMKERKIIQTSNSSEEGELYTDGTY